MIPTDPLFRKAFLISFFLHLVFWSGLHFKGIRLRSDSSAKTIEIDLTKPFRIGGNPLLKAGGGTTLDIPKEKIGPRAPSESLSPENKAAPKEWLLPENKSTRIEKPQEAGPKAESSDQSVGGTGEGFAGSGGGWGGGEGEGGGVPLSRFPKLVNRSEILKLLKKLYPAAERQAGIEGVVFVDLHLTAAGNVQSSEVVESGGVSFDTIAKEVSRKMKFSPAYIGDNPVAVKIRQSIIFRLED